MRVPKASSLRKVSLGGRLSVRHLSVGVLQARRCQPLGVVRPVLLRSEVAEGAVGTSPIVVYAPVFDDPQTGLIPARDTKAD